MPASPWRQGACAFAAFVLVAVLQSWPLPVRLVTHLTGPPAGDTGVYVWNTWVFRHELVEGRGSPFYTDRIFSLDSRADLSLHNYTVFADVLSLPLQPVLGVVGAFNVIYLLNVALAGFGMFLLAKRLTGRAAESWIAGFAFACSAFLVARSTAHFSLVAAAPLPFFVYWFDRAWETQRRRDAVATGATLGWAAFCDPYYAVYCLMLGIALAAGRLVAVKPGDVAAPARSRGHVRVVLDVMIVALACLIGGLHFAGRGSVRIASISISMRTLYTPMLILTILVVARVLLTIRARLAWQPVPATAPFIRAAVAALLVAGLLLSPTLYAVSVRVAQGRMVSAPVMWRSSAPGVDLVSFFLPNPNHVLAPAAMTGWLAAKPGRFEEQIASLSLVGLGLIVLAWRRAGWRPSRFWMTVTIGFGLLALGPFIQIAGVNSYIPTPWTLLRYVPLLGAARMPSRFAVVALLGFCVLLAFALAALTSRHPRRRGLILWAAGFALAFEILPVPRTLYSAAIPSIYRTIAADSRPIRVLELPFGIRDGLSSFGDFSAASQFYQTAHGKRLVGGYLSRISQHRVVSLRRRPVLNALIVLSEKRELSDRSANHARRSAGEFLEQSRLGYVVIDTSRTTPQLRDFAITLLNLRKIETDGAFELYVPNAVKNAP
ncbi:MAG TPA: hypothetical protein VES67_13155 [Vicinamibacterales bacterium]|nr:hypothetical protein [Vicinamibacterales bacterium]